MLNNFELKRLKKEGNEDPSKIYMSYNYNMDSPTGLPLKTPEEYQTIIRDFYYK